MDERVVRSEEEWKQRLSPLAFAVCRKKATEPPFSGEYWNCKKPGIYRCGCCGNELFGSQTKFDSGTGWPSFWAPLSPGRVELKQDLSLPFMPRIEVLCSRCDAHLGHVFDDGPPPTGKRYCINSVALALAEKSNPDEESCPAEGSSPARGSAPAEESGSAEGSNPQRRPAHEEE